ncbi:hypothetical protein PGB90_002047 [Kerria lacca]
MTLTLVFACSDISSSIILITIFELLTQQSVIKYITLFGFSASIFEMNSLIRSWSQAIPVTSAYNIKKIFFIIN